VWGLYGKETAAIDGSKFKAPNSKKNKFSKKKLKHHLQYTDEKADSYLDELDANDEIENL